MPAKLIYKNNPNPEISVIIPSLDGNRGGNFNRLVEQLKTQTITSIEIIASINERPNGKARNIGVELASDASRYLFFFDDDVVLGSNNIIENILKVLENNKIGLVGASQLPPKGSSWKQIWISYDLNKAKFPIQKEIIDTEMATHAGMGCRREIWEMLGGESNSLITGTDTDLRDRLRQNGYRVVVAPFTWVYHPLPDTFMKVINSAIYNGRNQVGYRRNNEYQKNILNPFSKIDTKNKLLIALAREIALFVPHIFITNRRIPFGFRPLNALFRLIMVCSYSVYDFKSSK